MRNFSDSLATSAVEEAARKKRPSRARGRGFRLGVRRDDDNLITLATAARIHHEIVGRRRSLKVLAGIVHARPHLGVFDFDITSDRPRFLGVRRDRWIYFLKTRLLLYSSRTVFHTNGL